VTPSFTGARIRTQTDQVLEYLRATGPLDQFTAADELGVLRLGARIWDLKQRGYAIRTELVEAPVQYGGSRVAQYSLLRDAAGRGTPPEATPEGETSNEEPAPAGEHVGDITRLNPTATRHTSEPRTLDEALWTFGDQAAALGVSPTVREFRTALGAASESVAHRWLRVLEREGYLGLNDQLSGTAARCWQLLAPGYERLYALERARRIEAERALRAEPAVIDEQSARASA
jgi:alkylated DNA nucleotide flippase Atl1